MTSDPHGKEGPRFIVMVFATRLEAEPFIEGLGMTGIVASPIPAFRRGDAVAAISGIGKANAAIATTWCCSTFPCRGILNLGCAGAVNSVYKKSDIFHVSKVVEPDRPHLRTGTPCVQAPSVLPGFPGAFLATQDKPVISREDRLALSGIADLVDMEGAAVIQAARRFDLPAYLFKFVSDAVDDEDPAGVVGFVRGFGKEFACFIMQSVLPVLDGG